MGDHNGCYCSSSELTNFLRIMGCDQDADGKYRVSGGIYSFMGLGDEFVIAADACYYVQGRAVGLAGMYRSITARGKVKVIA